MFLGNVHRDGPEFFHEPSKYLTGSGYAMLCQRTVGEGTAFKQVSIPIAELDYSLQLFYCDPTLVGLAPDADTYISQGTLASAENRLSRNVISLSSVWVDLDLEKVGLDPLATLPAIEAHRTNVGLPPFSIVNFTGRGLHLKYVFSEKIHQSRFDEWKLLIASLAACFAEFGADNTVFDPCRVLRLPDTLNTKVGKYCRTLMATGDIYLFSHLLGIMKTFPPAATVHPPRLKLRDETVAGTGRRGKGDEHPLPHHLRSRPRYFQNPRNRWQPQTWVRLVAADLERLMFLRHEGGVLPPHQRNILLFPAFVYLACVHADDPDAFYEAVSDLCQRHCSWGDSETNNCISSLSKRLLADCSGEPPPVGFHKHVYTYKASTLIAQLSITVDEQVHLQALVDDNGRRERDRRRKLETRLAAGATTRQVYLAAVNKKRGVVLRMHGEGRRISEIVDAVGISRRTVYTYLKASSPSVQSPSAYPVRGGEKEEKARKREAGSDEQKEGEVKTGELDSVAVTLRMREEIQAPETEKIIGKDAVRKMRIECSKSETSPVPTPAYETAASASVGEVVSPGQVEMIETLMIEARVEAAKFLVFCKVSNLAEIPAMRYGFIIEALKKRIERICQAPPSIAVIVPEAPAPHLCVEKGWQQASFDYARN